MARDERVTGVFLVIKLIRKSHIDRTDAYWSEVGGLLNNVFREAAPDELNDYYSRHGIPTATLLLTAGPRVVGHLALYQREIRVGNESLRVGLLGEIAIAADYRRMGFCRRLVHDAHEYLRAESIPFSILFAFEPRVYVSSGYKLMQNTTRFRDMDGTWKTFIYHGSMYAELSGRSWPSLPIDLCGPVV